MVAGLLNWEGPENFLLGRREVAILGAWPGRCWGWAVSSTHVLEAQPPGGPRAALEARPLNGDLRSSEVVRVALLQGLGVPVRREAGAQTLGETPRRRQEEPHWQGEERGLGRSPQTPVSRPWETGFLWSELPGLRGLVAADGLTDMAGDWEDPIQKCKGPFTPGSSLSLSTLGVN